MITDTLITVLGRVATDPRVRRTDDGTDLCSFRLACTPRRFDRPSGQWVDGHTSWFSVTAWRALGANCGDSLRKGERVVVQGRVSTKDYVADNGAERTNVEIEASAVGHDLTWGRTSFTRVVRTTDVEVPARAEADALAAEVVELARMEAQLAEPDHDPDPDPAAPVR